MKENDIIIWGLLLNNQIVGTALLFEQEKISGLHFIGIIPQHRGRGYGKLLVTNSLNILKDKGHVKAVLQFSSAGLHLYKKIGFKEQNKIYHYKYGG